MGKKTRNYLVEYLIIFAVVVTGTIARSFIFPLRLNLIFFAVSAVVIPVGWEFLLFVNRFLDRKLPFEKSISSRIILQLFIGIAFMTVLRLAFYLVLQPMVPSTVMNTINAATWLFFLLIPTLINSFFFVSFFLGRWKASIILSERLEKDLKRIELESLRSQLNPHFLFNCLACINSYIVRSDAKTASQYLTEFAKLIRLVLENSKYSMIPFENEFAAIKLYLKMELLRFNGSFSYGFKIDNSFDPKISQIPPMLLQPFLENSLLHGFVQNDKQGQISISLNVLPGDRILIILDDNGIGMPGSPQRPNLELGKTRSLGIDLIKERLRILSDETGKSATVQHINLTNDQGETCGTRVLIDLPLVKK